MNNSITARIRYIFFRLLQDGKNHTVKELCDFIVKSNEIQYINSNTIYSTLYKIRNSSYSKYFIINNDGSYRIKQYLLNSESAMILYMLTNDEKLCIINTIKYDEAIQNLISMYYKIDSEARNIRCRNECKKIIKLNEEIYNVINECINKI